MLNVAVDVGQPETSALVFESQALVVDTHQVEDRSIEVVDVNRSIDDVVAVLVGLAIDVAAFDTAACHPDRETAGVMVTAEIAD